MLTFILLLSLLTICNVVVCCTIGIKKSCRKRGIKLNIGDDVSKDDIEALPIGSPSRSSIGRVHPVDNEYAEVLARSNFLA